MIPVEYMPLLAILVPAVASVLILLSGKHPNIREGCTLLASIITFPIVLSLVPVILDGGTISYTLFNLYPGLSFSYTVDAFGLIFAITSSSLWILVSLYSIGYMRTLEEHAQTRFYFCFAWAIFGALGIAFSDNLVTMYLHYEILTISTYPLVAHLETPEALAAGRKYLYYLLTSGAFFFIAIVVTYWLTGTTDFKAGGILSLASSSALLLQALFVCYLLGFMKAAWMPFHSWLPTAMIAPTPVSALLHAVAVVKAGVFGVIRIVCYIYGVDLMHALGLGVFLAILVSITVILANLFAIGEDNLKRRLAYSTINQLSFILLGVAMLGPKGVMGAMMHIPFHGFMKITLFLCAGALMAITGKTKVSEMAGIAKETPITMIAFTVGALGMCGLPPVVGFISKWYICLGTIEAGLPIFLAVALIASLLDVVYFFPIIKTAFFDKPSGEVIPGKERTQSLYLFMIIPLAITALFSIILFVAPDTFHIFDLARMAITDLFGGV